MTVNFKKYLLSCTKASDCQEIEVIQSLWSGYGKISRYRLRGSKISTVVVKKIVLDRIGNHPRGWNTKFSHERKIKSYQVEAHWYEYWGKLNSSKCKSPHFLGILVEGSNKWIVLEDLKTSYPIQKQQASIDEVKVCLEWLANFHTTFLGKKPIGLWEIGTYWHLATRPDEFKKIKHPELKAKANLIDKALNQCKYQSIVHGDAKLANFCFSKDGKQVAAVDFQYVGGGCGIKDVVYLLGSCLSSAELKQHDKELLNYYFCELQKAFGNNKENHHISFQDLEQEWKSLYPIAWTDFTRFMLGWMPNHQKINDYSMSLLDRTLAIF